LIYGELTVGAVRTYADAEFVTSTPQTSFLDKYSLE